MNATSLLVSTTRLVLQADVNGVGDPATLSDLYRLVPYLRQSLSCTVCGHLLREPFTPPAAHCQHHVCRGCLGGRKNLKPTCQWCRDYQKYEVNTQLRILLQCYRGLCEYIVSKPMYRHVIGGSSAAAAVAAGGGSSSAAAGAASASATTNGNGNGSHSAASNSLLELIEEGARFKDNYKSNSGQLKTTYSMLPCVYANAVGPASASAQPSAGQPIAQPQRIHTAKRMVVSTTQPTQQNIPASAAPTAVASTGHSAGGVTVKSDSKLLNMSAQRSMAPSNQLLTPAGMRMHVQTHQVRPPLKQQQQQHQQQQQLRQQQIRIQHQAQNQPQQQQPQPSSLHNVNAGQFKAMAGTKWIAATSSPQTVSRQHIGNPSTSTTVIQASSLTPQQQQQQQQQQRHSHAPSPSSSSTVSAPTYTVPTTAPIKTVSNGSAMYSVLYAGTGNKITIKRKTDGPAPQAQSSQHYHQQQQQQHANATAMRRTIQPIASTSASFLNRPVTVSQYPQSQQQQQQQHIPVKLLTSTQQSSTAATIRYQTQQPQQQQQQINFNQALLQQQQQQKQIMHNVQLQQLQQQNFKKPVTSTTATVRPINTSPGKPFLSTATGFSIASTSSTHITATTNTNHTGAATQSPVAGASNSGTTASAAAAAAAAAKRKGCRCGNATPTPGKLTCCGQRCPCYVEAKSCVDCKCRGCRNPHRPDGLKVRPHIPELDCIEMVPESDGGAVGGVLRAVMSPTLLANAGGSMAGNMSATGNIGAAGYLQLKSPQRFAVQSSTSTSSPVLTSNVHSSSSGRGGSGGSVGTNSSSSSAYMTTSRSSPATGGLQGMSFDQDSIIFNPDDLEDSKNFQVVNLNVFAAQQMPTTKATPNCSTPVSSTVIMTSSPSVATSSVRTLFLNSAAHASAASTISVASTHPYAVVNVDDDESDESGDEEEAEAEGRTDAANTDDGGDGGDDEEGDGDDDGDDEEVTSVEEVSADNRPLADRMDVGGPSMGSSYHMDGPDVVDQQLLQFEHMLDEDSSPLADDDFEEDFSPENSGRLVVDPTTDKGDADDEDDEDEVEDDDENDVDFSMSDEPSDVDLD